MDKINLTVAEANRLSNIGRNAILTAIQKKELGAFRVGTRKLLIPRKSLEQWIDAKVAEAKK